MSEINPEEKTTTEKSEILQRIYQNAAIDYLQIPLLVIFL